MSEKDAGVRLQNGTVIRHKVAGYEGIVDGTTAIKDCFTSGGEPLSGHSSRHAFQYRIVIAGESTRKIAPAEDLEILEGASLICCPNCRSSFQSVPGAPGKPRGRCQCGAWICPSCLCCQRSVSESETAQPAVCLYQRKRIVKKLAKEKKARSRRSPVA